MTSIAASPDASPRRELATRNAAWARRLALALGRAGATPNAVSVTGIGWSLVACSAFALAPAFDGVPGAIAFAVAAAAIQLRLLCNLLDGMLAVEGGLKTPLGELYNEIPDRLADVAILAGAGASARDLSGGLVLGCAAAIAALFTAYVRVLGGSLGLRQRFTGPMAKQHRMFVLTVAALCTAGATALGMTARAMPIGLAVITAGAVLTACLRIRAIAREMKARCAS